MTDYRNVNWLLFGIRNETFFYQGILYIYILCSYTAVNIVSFKRRGTHIKIYIINNKRQFSLLPCHQMFVALIFLLCTL